MSLILCIQMESVDGGQSINSKRKKTENAKIGCSNMTRRQQASELALMSFVANWFSKSKNKRSADGNNSSLNVCTFKRKDTEYNTHKMRIRIETWADAEDEGEFSNLNIFQSEIAELFCSVRKARIVWKKEAASRKSAVK